jgi:hyperosmotically inducible periplasmic protein
MKFGLRIACGVCAVLLSCSVFAQTPAPDANAQGAEATPMTKAQMRADRKAHRVANHALAKKVQQAIYKSKGLEDAEIAVFATASTGAVILTGMIMDPKQEEVATNAAQQVEGVSSVTSKLTLYEEGGGH